MIHYFRFQNCFSFLDETEVSFAVPKTVRKSGLVHETEHGRFSKVMVVMGANGSGKTNLLKPLAFTNWFISESFNLKPDEQIPFAPHFFASDETSHVEMEFSTKDDVWRYELSFTQDRVIREILKIKTSIRYSRVFERIHDRLVFQSKDFGFPEEVELRSNVSVLSLAKQHKISLANLVTGTMRSNVGMYGRVHLSLDRLQHATNVFKEHSHLKGQMINLLRHWDLGLFDVVIEKTTVLDSSDKIREIDMPYGLHRHGDQEEKLIMSSESSGTQGAFVLLSHILPALAAGSVAVVDELEADLHPHMLKPILDLFFSSATNPDGAQLLCTCHSAEILDILDKSQVVLVEKKEDCRSEAYRLDQVEDIRADDNLYAKYMAGSYGGVPWLQ